MIRIALPLVCLPLLACQPTQVGAPVTLASGERCVILTSDSTGRTLDCPDSGQVRAGPAAAPDIRPSDIPGVPSVPPVPQSRAEAECRLEQEAQNRIRGTAEGAVLEAVGLPGNLLGIWRRSQDIAARIEGQPRTPAPDPCAGL